MKSKKLIALAMVGSLILGSFVGCGKKADDKSSKDTKQKEINVYTCFEDEVWKGFIDDFNKVHPDIKVNVVRDTTGTITAKLQAEKANPKADVIWGVAASSLLILDKDKSLEGYKPKGIENIEDTFVDKKNDLPHWVGVSFWTGAITFNTEEAKKKNLPTPTKYSDLTNPAYKDQVVMPNPAASGTGYLMVTTWIQTLGEEKAWALMEDLNKNVKSYTKSGSAPSKSTAQGEQAVGLGTDIDSLNLQKKVPQVKAIFAEDMIPWEMEAVSLVKKEGIKDEAKVFIDWATSKEALELYGKHRSMVPLKGYKSTVEGYPSDIVKKLTKNDFYFSAENRARILDEWNKRFGTKK